MTEVIFGNISTYYIARWRCPSIVRTLDGEYRRCIFTCKKKNITKKHQHKYTLPSADDPLLSSSIIEKQSISFLNDIHQQILDAACIFAATVGLSAQKACSPAMYEFIIKILKIGKSLKCDEKHVSDIFSEIRLLDPKLFAKRLHRLGEIRREKDIEMAKNISFVNIASDAGTVLSFHTLYSLITNPFYPQFPVLLEIYDCGNGYNSVQYSEFFDLAVTPLID